MLTFAFELSSYRTKHANFYLRYLFLHQRPRISCKILPFPGQLTLNWWDGFHFSTYSGNISWKPLNLEYKDKISLDAPHTWLIVRVLGIICFVVQIFLTGWSYNSYVLHVSESCSETFLFQYSSIFSIIS